MSRQAFSQTLDTLMEELHTLEFLHLQSVEADFNGWKDELEKNEKVSVTREELLQWIDLQSKAYYLEGIRDLADKLRGIN